ncbi:MAG TPA: DUF1801 domain-containing protein [Sphingobacterium sp.]|nr:DUF1801 domain-containing protein [Sphingobacterium sp.]
MAAITNVEQYIAQLDDKKQALLQEVRATIVRTVPEATETISYQMPTYRYKGNLIHFALYKHHLGIYPGPEAIDHFKEELTSYKTSKGAIQIPLDQKTPHVLIEKLVRYNMEQFQHKSTPDWKRYHSQWEDAIEKIQQILHELPLDREFKWGSDVYTYQGKNVASYGGFKNHFAIWFYNGVFLEDKDNVLITASEGKTKSLRQWRFQSADEIDPVKIKNYLQEAIQTVIDGKEIKPEKSIPHQPSGLLKETLTKDTSLQRAFDKLSPGKQKEYIEYINSAKQEKTKTARIEKITPLIKEGKGLHDKYKR